MRFRIAVVCICAAFAGCEDSLHDVVHRRDAERAEAMLARDPALVHARNRLGKTPLHYAVTYGVPEFIDLLVEHGADVNAADNTGLTPLHVAATLGRVSEARQLIDYHADPDARDQFGDTPMHLAALHGNLRLVKLLAEAGAGAETMNREDQCPADLARKNRREEVLDYLQRLHARDD